MQNETATQVQVDTSVSPAVMRQPRLYLKENGSALILDFIFFKETGIVIEWGMVYDNG